MTDDKLVQALNIALRLLKDRHYCWWSRKALNEIREVLEESNE